MFDKEAPNAWLSRWRQRTEFEHAIREELGKAWLAEFERQMKADRLKDSRPLGILATTELVSRSEAHEQNTRAVQWWKRSTGRLSGLAFSPESFVTGPPSPITPLYRFGECEVAKPSIFDAIRREREVREWHDFWYRVRHG